MKTIIIILFTVFVLILLFAYPITIIAALYFNTEEKEVNEICTEEDNEHIL